MSDPQLMYFMNIVYITFYFGITYIYRLYRLMALNKDKIFTFYEPISLSSVITSFFAIISYAISFYFFTKSESAIDVVDKEYYKNIKDTFYYIFIIFISISVFMLCLSFFEWKIFNKNKNVISST